MGKEQSFNKWIKNLNVTAKTLKLLEGNRDINLRDLELINDFLDMIPKA